MDELGEKLKKAQGPADMAHLRKIIMWSRLCSWGGALTCWMMVNPVSIFLMSVGTMTRWTIIGHHVCHGGFDSVDKTKKYNRFTVGVLWCGVARCDTIERVCSRDNTELSHY